MGVHLIRINTHHYSIHNSMFTWRFQHEDFQVIVSLVPTWSCWLTLARLLTGLLPLLSPLSTEALRHLHFAFLDCLHVLRRMMHSQLLASPSCCGQSRRILQLPASHYLRCWPHHGARWIRCSLQSPLQADHAVLLAAAAERSTSVTGHTAWRIEQPEGTEESWAVLAGVGYNEGLIAWRYWVETADGK